MHTGGQALKRYVVWSLKGRDYVYMQVRLPDGTYKRVAVGSLDKIVDFYLMHNPLVIKRMNETLTRAARQALTRRRSGVQIPAGPPYSP